MKLNNVSTDPLFTNKCTMASLNNIVKRFENSVFCEEVMGDLEEETAYIGEKLGISPVQCLILAGIIEAAGPSSYANDNEIKGFLGITNIEYMNLVKDIEQMSKMYIVRIENCGNGKGNRYTVYGNAMDAICSDSVYHPQSNDGLSPEDVFSRFRILFSEYFDDALTQKRLNEELVDIIERNLQVKFCSKANAVHAEIRDRDFFNMFIYMCHRYASHGQISIDIERLTKLTNQNHDSQGFRDPVKLERDFVREQTPLQENGLIEFAMDNGFVDEEKVCLSEDIRNDWFTELCIKTEELPKSPDLKSFASICRKELVYNPTEKEQMRRISKMLDNTNFKGVQSRLKEQGMREGLNIIFYGAPGTGKTESCLQLARESGRDILVVDVSKLKDKYVGNSEKQVRGLFKYYSDLVKQSEKAPILLFNEADAIFGRRMENAEQGVDKMNNALQNIILQEMETISGVLIATTNLETCLDPAFERRFLMKVRFDMPDAGARQKIWKTMLPELTDKDAEKLAIKYEFSGGQIENISRKSMINYIIEGEKATMENLTKYCDEERFTKNNVRKPIGF